MSQRGSAYYREIGRRGAAVSAKARRKLYLDDVEAALGSLDTLDDAQRWLRQLALWAAGGLLTGAVASACNRAVEIWLKAHESRLVSSDVERLRARLDELEAQARRPRAVR